MSKKILIVEDSPTMRKLIKYSVKKAGDYDCVEACNGLEALEQLNGEFYDLVLTDINMPDMNGVEFIQNLRKQKEYLKTPVVVITTESNPASKKEVFSAGATDYLPKPFQPQDIEKICKEYL